MISTSLDWVILFFIQMKVGILGNALLVGFYTFTLSTGRNFRPTDQILNQLALANCLALFSKGIPQEMAAFGLDYFLSGAVCKLVFYLHRVSRGASLSTTCLLGAFQAAQLCSGSSWWQRELKIWFLRCLGPCCSCCWVLSLLTNIHIPVLVNGPKNDKNASWETKSKYWCSKTTLDQVSSSLIASMILLVDYILLGLMVWASGSMVLVLHRHKQRVQHLHSQSLSRRPSHEARATCTILILVSSFVLFHALSSMLTLHVALSRIPAQWLLNASVFVALCFPTLSPWVLLARDPRVSKLCLAYWPRSFFP
ncbi:vomeronasal type-1 receptor 1-like [Ochotona curzoniae]|uniref:vomeronasal type-1 receptor 1-like n=1 Tax=Ochotona curzoniae TaxID=130825 RepID=UPI001B347BD0|nr:vomeronasal type-1 receptor 1-like [Ochotona curzoniae]